MEKTLELIKEMDKTLELIKAFFKEKEIEYKTQALKKNKGTFIKFGIDTESIVGNLPICILVHENDYIVVAVLNSKAQKENLNAVSEYLHRANFGLKNGNFELDYADGEIRYKTYVNFENTILSSKVIEDSIMIPIAMFEQYGEGLMQTMVTGVVGDVE